MSDISIIVPVYNVEKYLDRCINSIIDQTYQSFDLILVDDGSDDNSGAICDRYANSYSYIYVIHQINCGLSVARNIGIEWAFKNSNSKYLTFVDSDDWVHPQYLSSLYEALTCSGCGVSVGRFNNANDTFHWPNNSDISYDVVKPESMYKEDYTNYIVAWGKLFNKEEFNKIKFPVGKIHEDEFVIWKILQEYQQLAVVQQPIYAYYQRADSIMGSNWNVEQLSIIDAIEEQKNWLVEHANKEIQTIIKKRLANVCAEQMRCMKRAGVSKKQYHNYKKRLIGYIRDARPELGFFEYYRTYKIAWPYASRFIMLFHRTHNRVLNINKKNER